MIEAPTVNEDLASGCSWTLGLGAASGRPQAARKVLIRHDQVSENETAKGEAKGQDQRDKGLQASDSSTGAQELYR